MRLFFAFLSLLFLLSSIPISYAIEDSSQTLPNALLTTDCVGGAVDGLVHDNGSAEGAIPISGTLDVTNVQRFIPPAYPYHFEGICIGLGSLHDSSAPLKLVIYDDDGIDGAPLTLLWESA